MCGRTTATTGNKLVVLAPSEMEMQRVQAGETGDEFQPESQAPLRTITLLHGVRAVFQTTSKDEETPLSIRLLQDV
jgi:hypothetical protein